MSKRGEAVVSAKVIVLVKDRDDSNYGKMTVLDDMVRAERLLETLLEAGFQRDRIQVFHGDQVELWITYKPAVTLRGERSSEQASPHEPDAEEARDRSAAPPLAFRND
jgi:hypothetical protein